MPCLFAAAQPAGCESLPGLIVEAFARRGRTNEGSAESLIHRDVVQIAQASLQSLQARYKSLASAPSVLSGEDVSEKFAGVAKFLCCDPQLVSLLRIECVDVFSPFYQFLPMAV